MRWSPMFAPTLRDDPAEADAPGHRLLLRAGYVRQLAVPALPCEASSGVPGGGGSTGFMCPSDAGEDRVTECAGCGYAATVERATSALPAASDGPGPPSPERFDTPGVRTIADLHAYGVPGDRQIKTLVYVLDGTLTLVLLRGDHPLNERKLMDATGGTDLRAAHPDEIQEALGALPGSLGAVGASPPVIADEALRGRRGLAEGVVEVTTRATGETAKVPLAEAVAHVRALAGS